MFYINNHACPVETTVELHNVLVESE